MTHADFQFTKKDAVCNLLNKCQKHNVPLSTTHKYLKQLIFEQINFNNVISTNVDLWIK